MQIVVANAWVEILLDVVKFIIFRGGTFLSKSGKVAICGVVSALSFICMMLTGVITIGTYALPALAGAFLIIPNIELSSKWASSTYFVVSLLSIFLVPDKEAALIFIIFLGYYPILKTKIERVNNIVIQYIIKLLLCNVSMVLSFIVAMKLLKIPKNSFEIFGIYLPWVFLIFGNVIFIMYDYAINDVIKIYNSRFRKYIKGMFK